MPDAAQRADAAKRAAAERACAWVEDGMALGLGTGSTAAHMLRRLGERVRGEGLRVTGVPTSARTAELARAEGIAVVTLDETPRLDLTIDGADEVDDELRLVKGGGGALLHEKIVAAASDRVVIVADAGKAVRRLGAFPLPVEVIGFGARATQAAMRSALDAAGYAGYAMDVRPEGGAAFLTDEGNLIVDCHLREIVDAAAVDAALRAIPGVVETGLFLNLAHTLVLGHADGTVEVRGETRARRKSATPPQGETQNAATQTDREAQEGPAAQKGAATQEGPEGLEVQEGPEVQHGPAAQTSREARTGAGDADGRGGAERPGRTGGPGGAEGPGGAGAPGGAGEPGAEEPAQKRMNDGA